MVLSVSYINQYSQNNRELEVIRRLQSLGLAPTGDLVIDRQRLQAAELQKRQQTLASNSEPSLAKLEGSGEDFYSTFSNIKRVEGMNKKTSDNKELNLLNLLEKDNVKNSHNDMLGAYQLAELNKLKLGLIA